MFYIGSVSIIGTLILVNIGYRNIGKRAYRYNTNGYHVIVTCMGTPMRVTLWHGTHACQHCDIVPMCVTL